MFFDGAEADYKAWVAEYKDIIKKFPDLKLLYSDRGDGDVCQCTVTRYEKRDNRWVEVESQVIGLTVDRYMNSIDAAPFFSNLGGKESITPSYLPIGYIPVETKSISPDGQKKTIRRYEFTI